MNLGQSSIDELQQTVDTFRSHVDQHITAIDGVSTNIQTTTAQVAAEVEEFKKNMTMSEEVGLASENIMRLDQIAREQFGGYEEVRRTVIGIVRDYDINLVRGKTIDELSQELWVSNSRYWLSYALIALAAWVNDYPELAANAVSECMHRDKIKATLFFTLLNLRFDRIAAAREWFGIYLSALDPADLPLESAVMLQAYLAGAFGRDKKMQDEVSRRIDDWIAQVAADEASRKEFVGSYRRYIEECRPSNQFQYPALQQVCSNVAQAQAMHDGYSRYAPLLQMVNELDVPALEQTDGNFKARIDKVLSDLISNYDRDEREVRDQKAYYEFVVKNDGDTQAAQTQYKTMLEQRQKGSNIGRTFLDWVLYRSSSQIDVHVRRFALSRTKRWLLSAIDDYDDALRQARPDAYALELQIQPGLTWTGAIDQTGSNGQVLCGEVSAFVRDNRTSIVFFNKPNIVAGVIGIVCIGLAFLSPFTLIGSLAATLFIVWNILSKSKTFDQIVASSVNSVATASNEAAMLHQYTLDCGRVRDEVKARLQHNF